MRPRAATGRRARCADVNLNESHERLNTEQCDSRVCTVDGGPPSSIFRKSSCSGIGTGNDMASRTMFDRRGEYMYARSPILGIIARYYNSSMNSTVYMYSPWFS